MALPTPYYQDDLVTLYHADCRDILPEIEPGSVDLVLTDPPYGIGMDGGNVGRKGRNNFDKLNWDEKPPEATTLDLCIKSGTAAIIWGGNYFGLPASRCWLVWNKGAGFRNRSYAEAELAWTNLDANTRVLDYNPLAKGDYRGKLHPTMKPLALVDWCCRVAGDWATVLDPFAGSCTTLVAAKRLGRRAIGIEMEESYCEIGAGRLGALTPAKDDEPLLAMMQGN